MKTLTEKIVTFTVGEELFAAEVHAVERVLKHTQPRTVPNVPEWVDGVIPYQGKVVPVVDLRRRFSLPPLADTSQARTLVVNSGGEWVGLVVDAVDEVSAYDPSQVQPPPPFFHGLAGEYLRGLLSRRDRLLIMLDFERFLSARERMKLEKATEQVMREDAAARAAAETAAADKAAAEKGDKTEKAEKAPKGGKKSAGQTARNE